MHREMSGYARHDGRHCSVRRIGLLVLFVALAGCAARGPQTVPADAFDYSAAITKTRSDQMLLNIVRSRYSEVPNFLTVGSVIAGYTYQGGVGASGQAAFGRFDESFVGGSANLAYIERPTITYTPLQGEEFSRRLMRNIPVDALFSLGQAGWAVDVLFRIAVDRIGETRNMGFAAAKVVARADEEVGYLTEYDRVINIITELSEAGVLETVLTVLDGEERQTVKFARAMNAEQTELVSELKSLVGLDPDLYEFHVTDHITGRTNDEILIQTRSLLAMMSFIGLGVDVPDADIDASRVLVTPAFLKDVIEKRGPMRVRVQPERPQDPFAAVEYRDHWFYIDGTDHLSKRTFSTVQLLFELLAPGGTGAAPLLTLPAG